MTTDASAWEDQLIADMRANGGSPSQGPLKGNPLMLLYTTGAKSGERRRSIVTYSRDGDAYVIAGTNNARPTNPAWVANIRANPAVTIEAGNKELEAMAVEATGAERDRLWDGHVAQLPQFGRYPDQITSRTIPMVRITPKTA
jgi:deazaflavin-dependent oxidoreductase (nitroreductase family)